jgi:hypothetical protein
MIGEVLVGGAAAEDTFSPDIISTNAVGDSPLMLALRRRQREISHSEVVVVTHDSMI